MMLFDTGKGLAISTETVGEFDPQFASVVPGDGLLEDIGVRAGLCVPIESDEGRRWLVICDIPFLGWGHLWLAQAMRTEIADGLNWQISSTNAMEAALMRLRHAVACDLHDSVAHSLAGAKFLLTALRSKVGETSGASYEIGLIKDALDAEYLHVRSLINQLRETEGDTRVRDPIEDLEAMTPLLSSRWRIRVSFIIRIFGSMCRFGNLWKFSKSSARPSRMQSGMERPRRSRLPAGGTEKTFASM